MKIEKSVEIKKNLPEVFAYLKHTRNQEKFSVWNMSDPNKKTDSKGTDGTVGYVYSWDSEIKNTGAGEQEIKAIVEGKSIEYEVKFFRPMKNVAKVFFHVTDKGNGITNVSWVFESPSKFPFVLFEPIFKKMLGKDLEKGLNNLKTILEK